MAPFATRWSRQSSLPVPAAYMRAVRPYCGGEGAAHHAVSGAGRRGAEGRRGAGGWGHEEVGREMHGRCRGDAGEIQERCMGDIMEI